VGNRVGVLGGYSVVRIRASVLRGRRTARASTGTAPLAWHHVVATGGPAGMQLYVDGALVGTNPNTGAGSHAAPGTYPITLTVTDAGGPTGVTTRTVTVT